MTTYNTGNPIGSTDARDLYDNAQNLDNFVNGASASYSDRLGVSRRSLAGIDAAADNVLNSIGYAVPVAYASGISLTLTSQTIDYNGVIYAPKSSALPFTTASWGVDAAKFRAIQVTHADLISYTPAGTGAVATTVQSKLRERVSILDFIPVSEHAAIKARTSTYDCYSAIMDAINSATYGPAAYAAGPAIYFPPGLYNCGTKIELKRTVHLLGDGSGLPYDFGAAEIKFASGVAGITVNRFNTINGGMESPTSAGADASIIEGLGISSAGGTADYGIWLRARALIRNCIVGGFSGVGIKVVAGSGAGGALEGNANNFRIEGVRIDNCGSHGLYTQGADANAGYIIGLDSSNNDGWGIYDSSFLGNTYIGCHVDASGLGAYKSDNANARNVFVGCYSESGQPASSFAYPCLVLGGLHGAGTTGSTGMLWLDEKIARVSFTDGASMTLKPGAIPGAAFSFQGSGDSNPWYWKKTGSAWEYSYANGAGVNVPMQMSHDGTRAKIAFQLGVYLGYGSEQRQVSYASAQPTTGTWQRGTVLFNTAPSAGGSVGWVCVADGTPGTWKTFGAISA